MPPRIPRTALANATRARLLATPPLPAAAPTAAAPPSARAQSSWSSAIDQAKNLVHDQLAQFPTSSSSSSQQSSSASSSATAFFGATDTASSSKAAPIIQDPLSLVSSELSSLCSNVSTLLGSSHPSLDTIAKYYFQAEGKHLRPLIVLLISKAVNGLSPLYPELLEQAQRTASRSDTGKSIERDMGINQPLSPGSVLNDFNPHMESIQGSLPSTSSTASREGSAEAALASATGAILPTQRRLAEITEMIHVASLLHDDVIDASPLRRGAPSAPSTFGNKLSILGGDFLLGRASVALARLRDAEVVELLATVISNLVEGEVMQLKSQAASEGGAKSEHTHIWDTQGLLAHNMGLTKSEAEQKVKKVKEVSDQPTPAHFSLYLQKTYLKTAALIAKSTRASVILAGCGADAISKANVSSSVAEEMRAIRDAAYGYGRNLGIAFQLVDDLLDFQSTSAAFGKPSGGADLRLGLATAPVLYAWQELPGEGIHELVARRFEDEGDVEKMLRLVERSNGLKRTADLATEHARRAREHLEVLPESQAKQALVKLNEQVIKRFK